MLYKLTLHNSLPDFTEFEEFKTSQTNELSNLLVWQKLKFKIQRSPLQE